MLNDCGDEFDDDDGELDSMTIGPQAGMIGTFLNRLFDSVLGPATPAPELKASAPAPAPSGDTLPAVRALAAHLERESKAKAAEPARPKKTGLASLIRFAGGSPAPAPERQPTPPKRTPLAGAFRFADEGDTQQTGGKLGLESAIRVKGSAPAPSGSKPASGGLPIDPEDFDRAPRRNGLAGMFRFR